VLHEKPSVSSTMTSNQLPILTPTPGTPVSYYNSRRSFTGFACCASSRKPPSERDESDKLVWNTADLGWFDFQKRRWRSFWLMKTAYYRTKRVETDTEEMPLGDEVDAMWHEVHELNAREIREHAEQEKGLLIKACQHMSALSGVLPDPYIDEFLLLTDHLPVSTVDEVFRVIRRDLKCNARDIFEVFNAEPIASASIAQVHRARLKGSDEIVAVKVQHDGVDRIFLEDVNTLTMIADQLVYWVPSLDFRPFCQEWSESLPRELNFLEERRALERARRALRKHGSICVLPRVHSRLTSQHVLVMDFIEAYPVLSLGKPEFCERHGIDKHVVLKTLLDAFGIMAFKDGLFHADPHAGNVRILVDRDAPGGAVPVLFDWGFFRELDEKERFGVAKVFHSIASMDIAGLFQVLDELGLKFKSEHMTDSFRREFLDRARSLMKDTVSKSQTRTNVQNDFADYKARLKREGEGASISPIFYLESWPRCVVFFLRMMQIVRGLCVAVNAEGMPFLDIFAQHAREALVKASTTGEPSPFRGRESTNKFDSSLAPERSRPPTNTGAPDATLEGRVTSRLEALLRARRIVGAQVTVVEGSRGLICDVAAGMLSSIDARRVSSDTRFPLLGATPGIAALAVARTLRRHHQGSPKRALHMPVSSVWPGFGGDESTVTIADVLSHSAGVQDAFPEDFGPRYLDDVDLMIEHLAALSFPRACKPHYAYLLQAFLLAKLGEHLAGQDSLLHWLGSELGPLGLDVAAPAGRGGEAAVCRDLPQLARVSMAEVSEGRARRKRRVEGTEPDAGSNVDKGAATADAASSAAGACQAPDAAGGLGSTNSPKSGSSSASVGKSSLPGCRTLLAAVGFDPLAFDPLQANVSQGGLFRAGLSLGVSARGLATAFSSEELQEDLRALGALELAGQDTTAMGWLLTGGACSWTVGGLQALELRGSGHRALLGSKQHGFGVVCGLGPCVAHFPDLGQGGITVAVMVNDVLKGREAAAELVAEALSGFGYAPQWPEMPMRVVLDASRVAKSKEAEPLLKLVGGAAPMLQGAFEDHGTKLRALPLPPWLACGGPCIVGCVHTLHRMRAGGDAAGVKNEAPVGRSKPALGRLSLWCSAICSAQLNGSTRLTSARCSSDNAADS